MAGRFIVFEGGEGSGKTTQAKLLTGYLRERGIPVLQTREPGGSPNAEIVRDLVVHGKVDALDPLTETLLLFAARNDHLERVIRPALERGEWVVCDRFIGSTYAYQGAGGGVKSSDITELVMLVCGMTMPHLTLWINVDPNVGLTRRFVANTKEGSDTSRFEAKDIDFHLRLHEEFRRMARSLPLWREINGHWPTDMVQTLISAAVEEVLGVPIVNENNPE